MYISAEMIDTIIPFIRLKGNVVAHINPKVSGDGAVPR